MRLDSEVVELLHGGYRWLLRYRDEVADIHHSEFQFLPRDTALFRVYKSQVKSSVQVVRGAPIKWTPLLSKMDFEPESR